VVSKKIWSILNMEDSTENKFVFKKPDGSRIRAMIVDDSQFIRKQINRVMQCMEIELCCEEVDGKKQFGYLKNLNQI
jgi:hypothetical protein